MTILLKQFSAVANAGDAASALIVAAVTGRQVLIISGSPERRPNLLGMGSILHWADTASVVWGAGLIAPEVAPHLRPKAVVAVRGPLTRDVMTAQGVACPDLMGDPGALLPLVLPASAAPRQGVGVAPHYVDLDHPFVHEARASGARIIDPRRPLPDYVEALTSCERVISSSLHGVIFAQAYGIPAAWVKLSQGVIGDGFKFRDYYASVGVGARDVEMLGPEEGPGRIAAAAALPPRVLPADELATSLRESLRRLDS